MIIQLKKVKTYIILLIDVDLWMKYILLLKINIIYIYIQINFIFYIIKINML